MTNKTLSVDIKVDDEVLILDGCFKGRVGTVQLVRPEKHYPYLVSLPSHKFIPYLNGQIQKK